jgi:chitodextrinase
LCFGSAKADPGLGVKLSWEANTEDDLAGYKVYTATEPGNYNLAVTVGNVTKWTVSGLEPDTTYFFATTAYDMSGNESGYSNEISATPRDITVPSNPIGLIEVEAFTIVINAETVIVNPIE